MFVNVILIIWRNHHEWYKQGLCMPITANFESSRLNSLSLYTSELKTCRSWADFWALILYLGLDHVQVNCWKQIGAGLPTVGQSSPNFYLVQFTLNCNSLVHDPAPCIYYVMIERTRPPSRAQASEHCAYCIEHHQPWWGPISQPLVCYYDTAKKLLAIFHLIAVCCRLADGHVI